MCAIRAACLIASCLYQFVRHMLRCRQGSQCMLDRHRHRDHHLRAIEADQERRRAIAQHLFWDGLASRVLGPSFGLGCRQIQRDADALAGPLECGEGRHRYGVALAGHFAINGIAAHPVLVGFGNAVGRIPSRPTANGMAARHGSKHRRRSPDKLGCGGAGAAWTKMHPMTRSRAQSDHCCFFGPRSKEQRMRKLPAQAGATFSNRRMVSEPR